MVKILVSFRRKTRRTFVAAEASLWRCVKRHRKKIIYCLHPISIVAMLLAIGLFSIYEMHYVLPEICERNGKFYMLSWVTFIYLLHNIFGNWMFCWLIDTSFMALPVQRTHATPENAHLWHLCTRCQMLVPPRAWHCRLCNCCMLKRDHHCNIAANCIGHANQRYFVALLVNLLIGTVLSLVFNILHLWSKRLYFIDAITLVHAIFGLYPFVDNEFDVIKDAFQTAIISGVVIKLNMLAIGLTSVHLGVQVIMIWQGSCMFALWDRSYDCGLWHNVREVLGKRYYLVLFSPFINSPLPHDGTEWRRSLDQDTIKPA